MIKRYFAETLNETTKLSLSVSKCNRTVLTLRSNLLEHSRDSWTEVWHSTVRSNSCTWTMP